MIDEQVTNKKIRYKMGKMILVMAMLLIIGYLGYQNFQLNKKLRLVGIELSKISNSTDNEQKYLYNMFSSVFYNKKNWFTKMSNAMIRNQMLMTDVSDHEEAKEGKYVVLLLEGGYCTEPLVYRYDTTKDIFEKAKVESKKEGCLDSGGYFSSNWTGDVSRFITKGGDAGCGSTNYFSYDVDKNIATLIKDAIICEGDKEETVTEY